MNNERLLEIFCKVLSLIRKVGKQQLSRIFFFKLSSITISLLEEIPTSSYVNVTMYASKRPGSNREQERSALLFTRFLPGSKARMPELLVINNNRTFSFFFIFVLIRHLHHSVTSGNLILLHRTLKASFLKYTKSQIRKDSS